LLDRPTFGGRLGEALELVCLYAQAQDAKFERAALRWHARFVTEASPSMLQAQIALAALGELRSGSEASKKVLLRTRCPRLGRAVPMDGVVVTIQLHLRRGASLCYVLLDHIEQLDYQAFEVFQIDPD
jgi:hypothetical protein